MTRIVQEHPTLATHSRPRLVVADATGTPTPQCQAAKSKSAGKYAAGRQSAETTLVTSGDGMKCESSGGLADHVMLVRCDKRLQSIRRGALICLASVSLSLGAGTVPVADAGGFHFSFGPPVILGFGGKNARAVGLRLSEQAAFEAVEHDNVDEATEYLRRNGNPQIKNETNETMLEVAAYKGNWRVLQAILLYPVPVSGEDIGAALVAAGNGGQNGNDTRRVVRMLRSQVPDTEPAPVP